MNRTGLMLLMLLFCSVSADAAALYTDAVLNLLLTTTHDHK